MTLHVETEINPTETETKVRMAVGNIFGNISMDSAQDSQGNILIGQTKDYESLFKFRNLLRLDRIRDAARKALFRGTKHNIISFCLNKQVAFAGHISFSEEVAESPLGSIKVRIECDNPKQIVEWLTQRVS